MAKRSENESYRLAFFIISTLIMVCMLWLLGQEWHQRRPWKGYQNGWFAVERARFQHNLDGEQQFLKSGTLVTMVDGEEEETDVGAELKAVQQQIDELTGAIAGSAKHAELEEVKDALAKAEIKVKEQEQIVAFAKAEEDEYYYYYRHAKHAGHDSEAKEHKEKVDAQHEDVLTKTAAYVEAVKARDALLDKKAVFENELVAARKKKAELRKGVIAAERALEKTTKWDLERHDVRQFWNQEIDLVDRCHTCHMGYDKCGFTAPKEILGQTIEKKLTADQVRTNYCVTRAEADAYLEAAEAVRDSWYEEEELTFESEEIKSIILNAGSPEDKPALTEPLLVAAQELSKKFERTPEEIEALYRTHPRAEVLLKAHPVQTYGCTSCHYGQGRQIKGVNLNYLAAALDTGNDKHFAPFNHARNDHYWESQMLDTSRNHTEASCFNCHANDYELELAPNLTEGRKLVQHLGCTGCHPLGPLDPQRKNGPTLKTVASKIDTDWMYRWIQYPKAMRTRTRMPNFWPDAVKDDGSPNVEAKCNGFDFEKGAPFAPAVWGSCVEQRDEEAAQITAYLQSQSKEQSYPSMPSSASAARGEELFAAVGCQGCHNLGEWKQASTLPGTDARDIAPNLSGVGNKVKDTGWFFQWLKDPKSYWHETRMPSLRLTDQEAWDLTAYLTGQTGTQKAAPMSEVAKTVLADKTAVEKGRKLVDYYGCAGCHEINGFENASRIGADLTLFGSKPAHKLDFGDVPELVSNPANQTWENWLVTKLKKPRSYSYERATTRMPQFDLTDAEVQKAVLFLKSQNEHGQHYPEHVKHNQDANDSAIQRGAFLVDVYNCRGCHLIDGGGVDLDGDHQMDGGDILAAIPEDDRYRAPPKLIKQGAKVYPDWFYGFLKAPFKVRENYRIRMPTFQLSDEEAGELVAYFAAKAETGYPYVEKKRDVLSAEDKATAKKLFAEAQCSNCHILDGRAQDAKNVAPNLRLTAERLQYDWLFHWLKNPQESAPGVGMPNFFAPVDDKPGEYETPLIDIADGDWRRQIELLRAYVIELGYPAKDASASNGARGKKRASLSTQDVKKFAQLLNRAHRVSD